MLSSEMLLKTGHEGAASNPNIIEQSSEEMLGTGPKYIRSEGTGGVGSPLWGGSTLQ